MDHLEARNLGATEKYVLGTLGESERDAFEEHFFDCLECAEDVRAAAIVLSGVRTLAETAPAEAPSDIARKRAAAGRRRRRFVGSHGVAAAFGSLAAAACFMAVYQRAVIIPRLESELLEADTLQPISSHFLTLTRSEAPVVTVGAEDRHAALTLSRSWDTTFPSYRCELRDGAGAVLISATLPARSTGDELELLLPVAKLPAGSYALVVEGIAEVGSASEPARGLAPVARYPFNLVRR